MCDCNQNKCKCTPSKYSSELIWDGLKAKCAAFAGIKPNCTPLNDVLDLIMEKICELIGVGGLDGAGYKAQSVTSQALDGALTSRNIVITPIAISLISTGTSYQVGCRVRLASQANPTVDYFEGVITAFNNTTGAMTFTADHFGATASGSHTDWLVSLAGDVGASGAAGGAANVYKVQTALAPVTGPNIGFVWPGSSYTILAGQGGNHDIIVEGNSQINNSAGDPVESNIRILKNGAPLTPIAIDCQHKLTKAEGIHIIPFYLSAKNVALVPGDVITIEVDLTFPSQILTGKGYYIIKQS